MQHTLDQIHKRQARLHLASGGNDTSQVRARLMQLRQTFASHIRKAQDVIENVDSVNALVCYPDITIAEWQYMY